MMRNFLIQQFLYQASPLARMIGRTQSSRERQILCILEDLHQVSMQIREISNLSIFRKMSTTKSMGLMSVQDKITKNAVVLGSPVLKGTAPKYVEFSLLMVKNID